MNFRRISTRAVLMTGLLAHGAVRADRDSAGWAWGVNCAASGSFGSANFSASTAEGFSGSGNCSRTSTHFTKFDFTSSSGGTLLSSTIYGLNTGDLLIVPPTLSSETEPIFAVETHCPVTNRTLTWIFVQWGSSWGTTLSGSDVVMGTASYDVSAGLSVTSEYNVSGGTVWTGAMAFAGSCNPSTGIYATSGSGDHGGTLYLTANAGGVYKTGPGHAAFFFPQYTVSSSADLGSKTAMGILFDSVSSSDTRSVQVTTNSSGNQFTIKPYSDPGNGTLDSSGTAFTDNVAISAANSPQNGMLEATVTRTGAGAGSGNLVCIVNKDFDVRVICSGQSPSDNTSPYTMSFTIEGSCPANFVRVPKDPSVGAYNDFCAAKYEMKNVSGVATSQTSGTPWISITRDNAITQCTALGTGYDLISNAQWQAMARNLEKAYTSGSYLNWSNGSRADDNFLTRGNSILANSLLDASTDDDPCAGTGKPSCADPASADFTYRRTFQLSTGDILWDVAGNALEWVKDDNTSLQGTDGYIYDETWSSGGQTLWGPSTSYNAYPGKPSRANLGYAWLNASAGTIARGGRYDSNAGVFSALLQLSTTDTRTDLGFRCVYRP